MIKIFGIELRSPMGIKKGRLIVNEIEKNIEGTLECLGKSHFLSGMKQKDGRLMCKGILNTPLGEEPFEIDGCITGNKFAGQFKRKNQTYEIKGQETETGQDK